MAKRLTLTAITAILANGTFNELIGASEDDFLECKAAPYQLEQESEKQELAKDVSAIANASTRRPADGGYVFIGVRTRKSATQQRDIVSEVSPFAEGLVNTKAYLDVLRSWLMPMPDGVTVVWYPMASDPMRGIVAIFVPWQPPGHWPFLVTKVVEQGATAATGTLVGYYERQGDNIPPWGPADLQRLLRDGSRFGELSGQLAAVADQVRTLQRASTVPPGLSDALREYRERRATAIDAAIPADSLVFTLAAVPVDTIDLPALFRARSEPLVKLLDDPPSLRPGGFGLDAGETQIVEGRLRRALSRRGVILECWRDGTLIFAATGRFLGWGTSQGSASLRVNPLALAESAYLFATLAKQIYSYAEPPPGGIEFSLMLARTITNGQPLLLTAGPLRDGLYSHSLDVRQAPAADQEFPIRVGAEWSPGAVAYDLVSRVYTWFGFNEDAVPYAADVDGRREINSDELRNPSGTSFI